MKKMTKMMSTTRHQSRKRNLGTRKRMRKDQGVIISAAKIPRRTFRTNLYANNISN